MSATIEARKARPYWTLVQEPRAPAIPYALPHARTRSRHPDLAGRPRSALDAGGRHRTGCRHPPTPIAVWKVIAAESASGDLWHHMANTLRRVSLAFALAMA